MKTDRLKDIMNHDFDTNETVSENWYSLEKLAVDFDFVDESITEVNESEIAGLEKRLNAKINWGNNFAFYYLVSSIVVVLLSITSVIGLYENRSQKITANKALSFSDKVALNYERIYRGSNDEFEIESSKRQEIAAVYKRVEEVSAGMVFTAQLDLKESLALELEPELKEIQKPRKYFDYRYLRNFRVLNFKSNQPDDRFKELKSTSPQFAFSTQKFEASQQETINYYRMLERALVLLKRGKLEKSERIFASLQYLFPKDENVLFYRGLVNYKLGDFGYALSNWKQILEENESLFSEESAWYSALALMQLNQLDKAKLELDAIVKSEGFYKEQAISKLSEIE